MATSNLEMILYGGIGAIVLFAIVVTIIKILTYESPRARAARRH